MKKTPVITAALLSALVLLSACNTVEGAGRDVSSAGDAVAGAAKDAK
ncbi:MAG TPA: entericidin A/B family lipoprotein [Sphingobium sp.]